MVTHSMHRVLNKLLFILKLLALTNAMLSVAAASTACLPTGLSILPAFPNSISLYKSGNLNADMLLAESQANAVPKLSSATYCTDTDNAELSFLFFDSDMFGNPMWPAKTQQVIQASGDKAIKAQFTNYAPSNLFNAGVYPVIITYTVLVRCTAGGLGYSSPSNYEIRITGVNDPSKCAGAYTVDYDVLITQNAAALMSSNSISTAAETTGFRMRTSFYENGVQSKTFFSTATGSTNIMFKQGLSCTYAVNRTNFDFGQFTNLELFNNRVIPKPFYVTLSNCINVSGQALSIFWRFDRADPRDNSYIPNTATTSPATNIIARITCNGILALDQTLVPVLANVSGYTQFACAVALLKDPDVVNAGDITSGNYTGKAYLNFQFQ